MSDKAPGQIWPVRKGRGDKPLVIAAVGTSIAGSYPSEWFETNKRKRSDKEQHELWPVRKGRSDKPLVIAAVGLKNTSIAGSYPSEWFETNKRKPTLRITKNTLPQLYHLMIVTNKEKWNDVIAASYMVRYMQEPETNEKFFKKKLEAKWESFNQTLGEADEEVTPWCMYTLEEGTAHATKEPLESGDADKQKALFNQLVVLYKRVLDKNSQGTYANYTQTRINNFLAMWPYKTSVDFKTKLSHAYNEQCMTENYKRVICGLDMFFEHFPKAEFVGYRIGTLPSRYRGCSALTSLGQVAREAGIHVTELCSYAATDSVGDDLQRVTKTGEESTNPDGYFPYHLEMGLVNKSMYSIQSNPALYFWLHVVGIAFSLERSKKARMPTELVDFDSNIRAGAGLFFYLKKSDEQVENITNMQKTERLPVDDRETLKRGIKSFLIHNKPSQETDAGEKASQFINELNRNNGLTEEQESKFKDMLKGCNNMPKGTVGRYLYENFR